MTAYGRRPKMQIERVEMPIRESKELEDLKAKTGEQASEIEYLSMMSGIELVEEGEGNGREKAQ
jgi:hypothetical protein